MARSRPRYGHRERFAMERNANADGTRRGTPSHELPTQPRVSKYFKSSADLRVKKMGRTHSVLLCLIDSFFRRGRKWHSFEIGRNRSWLRLELALIFWKMEKRIFSDETRLMKIRFHRSISIRGLWNFLKIIRNLFQKSIYRIKISLFGLFNGGWREGRINEVFVVIII